MPPATVEVIVTVEPEPDVVIPVPPAIVIVFAEGVALPEPVSKVIATEEPVSKFKLLAPGVNITVPPVEVSAAKAGLAPVAAIKTSPFVPAAVVETLPVASPINTP
jgi:hypothetical protein